MPTLYLPRPLRFIKCMCVCIFHGRWYISNSYGTHNIHDFQCLMVVTVPVPVVKLVQAYSSKDAKFAV